VKALEENQSSPEVYSKARRAKQIIIWAMAILMLLPVLLVWLTGSIRF
jgi:hypothetical protein